MCMIRRPIQSFTEVVAVYKDTKRQNPNRSPHTHSTPRLPFYPIDLSVPPPPLAACSQSTAATAVRSQSLRPQAAAPCAPLRQGAAARAVELEPPRMASPPRAEEGRVAIATTGSNAGMDGIASPAPSSPPPVGQIQVGAGGSSPETATSSRAR